MIVTQPTVFIGKDRSRTFRDYIASDNFFLVFEAEEGLSKHDGHAIIKKLESLRKEHGTIRNLNDLEIWLQEAIITADAPAHFSLAAGVVYKSVLYVKTVGKGEVHLRRGKDFVRLIHGDKSASGYVEEGDVAVFTTDSFRQLIEEEDKLEKPLMKEPPGQLVDSLEQYFVDKNDKGSICVFADIVEKKESEMPLGFTDEPELPEKRDVTEEDEDDPIIGGSEEEREVEHDAPQSRYHHRAVMNTEMEDEESRPGRRAFDESRMKMRAEETIEEASDTGATAPTGKSRFRVPAFAVPAFAGNLSRVFTAVVVVVIFIVLVWTVVFGYQRRQQVEALKKIDAVELSVTEKTAEAEEIAFLNLDQAIVLLEEAKTEIAQVEEEVGPDYVDQLQPLKDRVVEAENLIVRKDERQGEEFFDLAVESADAKGDDWAKDGDRMAILDKANNTVYNFSLEDKSLEKSTNDIVGEAEFVGISNGVIYVFDTEEGLYQFTDDTEVELVIDQDEDWGKIVDMAFFGGNVYLLDSEEGDIHKYIPTANGFSEKSSYFIGTAPEGLASSVSLAIDASIYVALSDSILKFTRGEADDFSTEFPTSSVQLTRVYTDEETEQAYVWDKTNGAIYTLSKTGTYQQQTKSSVLTQSSDIAVYNNQILVLTGSKIYSFGGSGGSADSDEE